MADADRPTTPDFGPRRMHPTAGATLLAAREPLVAFNLQLAPPATLEDARGDRGADPRGRRRRGCAGLRAIGVALGGDVAQVSMNVERPLEVPLAAVVEAVRATRGGGERRAGRPRAARPRSRASPRTCRCPASIPRAT